ncbi:MAG: ABC transporter permease [Oscillospiraceae bacterium]|nr:ABC transporter permease [Oscillospiraceae bacterium]
MNGFALFFRKEILELFRTVKGIILAVIFLLVGISSPVLAKLTPEIIKWAGIDGSDEEFAALTALIPTPDSAASYEQFFSNFNTMGLISVIIVFAGVIANEKSKGTAAYMLTKNISRTQFILSKLASAAAFVFASLIISLGSQMIYTGILFGDKIIDNKSVIIFSALLFLYLIFILTFTLFSSVLTKTATSAAFLGFLFFIVFNIFAALPKIGKYMPPLINNFGIITAAESVRVLLPNIIITVICCAAFVVLSVKLFKRQEL